MQPYVAPKPENLSESQPSGQLPQYVHGNGASIGASGTVPIYQSSGNSQRYNGYQQTSQYQPPPQFQQQAQYQQAQYQQAQYQQPQYQQPQRQQHARYQFSHQQQQYYEQVNDQQNYRAVQFYSQHITGTALAGNQSYEGYSNGGARTNITTGTTANGGTGTNVTTGINANGGTGTTSNGARAAAYCPMFLEYYPHDPGYPQTSAPAKVLNLCEGIRKIDLKMIAVLHGDNRKTPCLAKCEYCYNGRSRCVKLVVNGKLFEQKKMQCCFCWKQLADWDQYGDHLAKCDSVKKLHVCCLCPFKAETRDELDDHFRNCEGDEI
ncbi:hypothetical protein KR074_007706 [Drosophila pseudoananassae]|nr:hypothetical protein KR074_007706 [Drosophila pseudoananassae]